MDRLAGMPVTRNVVWDERLESFKGRDTTHYVATSAAIATKCAVCRRPLQPNELLSLSVDIIESTAPHRTGRSTSRSVTMSATGTAAHPV